MPTCSNCLLPANGKFCTNCGQALTIKRITLSGLLHEVFHTFTHLDKGYGYTVKQLIRQPGTMQRRYLEGNRSRHQKPFSYYFINATAYALLSYWITLLVARMYGFGNSEEGYFFRHYFALTQVLLLPFYALVSWLVWKAMVRSTYNYGEMLVLTLYSAGTFLLLICLIALAKLAWPDLNTRLIEVPLLVTYGIITNLRFFHDKASWAVILGGILTFGINYFVSNFTAWQVQQLFH